MSPTAPSAAAERGATRARSAVVAASLATLAAAVALALAGCGSSYDPPSLINKLRVLAVRAEPPVMRATAPTTLTPLVVGVEEPLCYGWAFCPFAWAKDGRYRCFDSRLLRPLGVGATATLTPADVFASLAQVPAVFADLGLELPKGLDPASRQAGEDVDLEVQVLFKVETLASVGGTCPADVAAWVEEPCADREACLAGVKKLAFAQGAEAEHSNPQLEGLRLDGVLWPEAATPTVGPYRGDPDDTFFGLAQGARKLLPLWSEGSREVIGASLDPSSSEERRESLLFSWFSTAGDYEKQRSFDDIPDNALLPPGSQGKVRIWLVVRDGRNGVDWLSRELEVVSPAPAGHPLCALDSTLDGCGAER